MPLITPYQINVPEDRIVRLKQKLALSNFPGDSPRCDNPWARGSPLADVKRLARSWEQNFSWRDVEVELNKLPQYMADIAVDDFGEYGVHFIHQKSAVVNAVPLLFLHGWPGSFLEVTKILPSLVRGGENVPAFHVVAPSLIDFGFSSASRKKGFSIDQHAEAYNKLMQTLGYSEYIVQAGDIGSLIARSLALNYGPVHCKATHLNSAIPVEPTAMSHPSLYAQMVTTPLTSAELEGLERTTAFFKEGNGYISILSTRPQTIAYSLADSPIGLLAWMYEKLVSWTDNYPWTDDEVLTWVSVYWFSSAGAGASGNLYWEMEHTNAFEAAQKYVPGVLLGITRFGKDNILLPKLWNETLGPLAFECAYERGGHFAAWEMPDAIVEDLRQMFGLGGGAYGCVKGGLGYK